MCKMTSASALMKVLVRSSRKIEAGCGVQTRLPGVRDKAKLVTTHYALQLMINVVGGIHYTAALSTNFSHCFRFIHTSHRFCASLQLYTDASAAVSLFFSLAPVTPVLISTQGL